MKKISFDFDGTLEFNEVQEFAKELIEKGYNVCILTTRFSDPTRYNFNATKLHQRLFDVAKGLGIEEIHFTEYEFKYKSIDSYGIDIHLDDDYRDEVYVINKYCKAKAVLYGYGWKKEFEKVLKDVSGSPHQPFIKLKNSTEKILKREAKKWNKEAKKEAEIWKNFSNKRMR